MSRRPSRKCKKKATKEVDASHYVGYVEDGETVDMIMKKFEELAKFERENAKKREIELQEYNQKKGTKSGKCEMDDSDDDDDMIDSNEHKNDGGLTEEQLHKLFERTSTFTTKSIQSGNAILFDRPIISNDGKFVEGYDDRWLVNDFVDCAEYDGDAMLNPDYEDEYYDEFDDEYYSDDNEPRKKSRHGNGYHSKGRNIRASGIDFGSALNENCGITASNYTKKCWDFDNMEIPKHPIPRSWMTKISEYKGNNNDNDNKINSYYKETDILSLTINDYINELNMDKNGGYLGILMEPPIKTNDINDNYFYKHDGLFTMNEFKSKFTMNILNKLCPKGMLFIWIESQLISEIVEFIEMLGYKYVEHAAWILKRVNNKLALINKYGLCQSKKNLFLFRRINLKKKNGYKIELRHQRVSDVYPDFIRYHNETGKMLNSDYHYKIIETLLPSTIEFKKNNNKSKLLYLWAPKNESRKGWTIINDPRINTLNIHDQ